MSTSASASPDGQAPRAAEGRLLRVGLLALQGDFAEHALLLRQAAGDLGETLEVREVRLPRDLEGLDGLIIPGGESTTIGKLLVAFGLEEPVQKAARQGLPVWGTCAGMILLARSVQGGEPEGRLGLIDVTVQRNAFGRQVDSFQVSLPFKGLDHPVPAVFIRAPFVTQVGPAVERLAELEDGRVVAARQENVLVTAFHPELTQDSSVHRWFLEHLVGSRR